MKDRSLEFVNVVNEYMKENGLSHSNIIPFVEKSYVNFHNFVTLKMLGQPDYPKHLEKNDARARVYIDDSFKNKEIEVNSVSINALYIGIAASGSIMYDYDGFPTFIKELYMARKQLKTRSPSTYQFLVKIYLNSTFMMCYRRDAIISGSSNMISNYGRMVIDKIRDFFEANGKKVYYIDTDELFIEPFDDDIEDKLKAFYKSECSNTVDQDISKLEVERGITINYSAKKQIDIKRETNFAV